VREKIYVIPNWYDDCSVAEVADEDNKFFKENKIDRQGKFIVQFAGTLDYVLDFDVILNVAEQLQGQKDIEFHVIGDGSRKKEYFEQINKRGLLNVKTFPWQRLEIIQDVYSGCDVCLLPLRKGVIEAEYPSKARYWWRVERWFCFR